MSKEEDEYKESQVKALQERLFGKRYIGACIGKLSTPAGTLEKISSWVKKRENFLVIVGPAGTSKTYFCAAMIEILYEKFETFRAYDERDLFQRVRSSMIGSGDYLQFLGLLLDDDLIIIDDVGSSGHTDWREEVLFDAIDQRYSSMKPTIVTSNLTKKDFYNIYGQRISSRLFAKENTIINLEGLADLREEGL